MCRYGSLKNELMELGVQNDRKEIILYMLGNNFSPDQIHQMTNIPLAQVHDVAARMGARLGK